MIAPGVVRGAEPARAGSAAVGFFGQEFLRVLRSRPAALLVFFMLYAVVGLPVMLGRPQEELLAGIRAWFGESNLDLKLFLFAWSDAAMNKICVMAGSILSAGIITDERSRGMLDIYLAKPLTPRRYFVVKLLAAAAVFLCVYAVVVLAGILRFSSAVKGFQVGPFLLLSAVHVFAAVYAVTFAGVMAVFFRHKLTAVLTSICVLSLLVGMAFVGFYDPALRAVSVLNPFFHGVRLVAVIDHARPADVVAPILWLLGFNAVTAFAGAQRAAGLARRDGA